MNKTGKTYDLVYIALGAVMIAVCSWISIPTAIPFTMQTFAVFAAVGILGGKRGTAAVLVYILMGAVGLPVFAGFTGGAGILLGTTGGYFMGFVFSALFMWGMERIFGKRQIVLLLSMIVGLCICYLFGTLWFMGVYMKTSGAVGIGAVLGWCVIPFIIPDLLKIGLAMIVSKRVSFYLGRQ
ncbi:biotin transporter BioY [Clostridium sp. AM58-1XD]|uniref:biotin transporter BioY n=1 Tax=Clostridium sp. AM58-1XD TaxID=2292307 RepID=UPI000E4C2F2C|nr:biotin transporter BioY [Clostridium sp. AM58-1XD]RGZ01305.1 biotin transporter BioY [Clostridium sp. AM58-1XD]